MVRILPELAVRVSVYGAVGRAVDFPEAQGIARIEARRRRKLPNRIVKLAAR